MSGSTDPAALARAEEHCRALEADSREVRTPCGKGTMLWRMWGSGAPLVLFHGGSGSWRHWIRNIPELARDRLVIAPDLPGLGLSDRAPPPHEPGALAHILAGGLERVLPPGEAWDLVGFSFGGLMSGHVAALRPRGLRSLTLVAPGGLGVIRMPFTLEKVRGRSGPDLIEAHRTNLERMMFADPGHIDPLAVAVQAWNSAHARLDSRPLGRGDSLLTALRDLPCPLNAVYGDRDAIMPDGPGRAEAVLRELAPDVNFRVLPGVGHWVAYEGAERFDATLRDLLARPGA